MYLDRDRPGYALADDYPESYGPADLARLRAVLGQQVAQLGGGDRAADDRLLGILIGRRSARPRLAQLELRPHRSGFRAIVARGEVVLAAAAYPRVKALLADYVREPGGLGPWARLRRREF